ncbi:MAG: hypothetical protein ACE37H_09450 [Phycisphaeraceae bacterium]
MMPYRLQRAVQDAGRRARVLRGMAHVDRHDLSGTVLLAGSGRSGTTWLGQIVNHGNAYRDVFEPFHPGRVERLRGWPAMRYLPSDAETPSEAHVVRGLLAGRVRTAWTDAYNRKAFPKQRLIKAIRANLMLGWIRADCPQVTLLFAMRHPCAVAYSRLKLGWETHLGQLLDQPRLVRDHLGPCRELVERVAFEGDAWQRHVTMWCIENVVPLRQLRAGEAHVLQYERVCESFDSEAEALFGFLSRATPRGIERARHQHSPHFRRDSAILRGGSLIHDWQSRVNTAQIDQALALLDAFGLGHLYSERAMPRVGRDDVFIDSRPSDRPTASRREAA